MGKFIEHFIDKSVKNKQVHDYQILRLLNRGDCFYGEHDIEGGKAFIAIAPDDYVWLHNLDYRLEVRFFDYQGSVWKFRLDLVRLIGKGIIHESQIEDYEKKQKGKQKT